MTVKRGAGIIPFSLHENQLHFLFHRTFSGRRAGMLVDFGGSSHNNESHEQTAAREFTEETEAMFLADDPNSADLKRLADMQTRTTLNLIQDTQRAHPDWWCQRINRNDKKPKDWKSFFAEIQYKDVARLNELWKINPQQRFKKRRELVWIKSDRLLRLFNQQPEKLWTRVRELDRATAVIRTIEHHYCISCNNR